MSASSIRFIWRSPTTTLCSIASCIVCVCGIIPDCWMCTQCNKYDDYRQPSHNTHLHDAAQKSELNNNNNKNGESSAPLAYLLLIRCGCTFAMEYTICGLLVPKVIEVDDGLNTSPISSKSQMHYLILDVWLLFTLESSGMNCIFLSHTGTGNETCQIREQPFRTRLHIIR